MGNVTTLAAALFDGFRQPPIAHSAGVDIPRVANGIYLLSLDRDALDGSLVRLQTGAPPLGAEVVDNRIREVSCVMGSEDCELPRH